MLYYFIERYCFHHVWKFLASRFPRTTLSMFVIGCRFSHQHGNFPDIVQRVSIVSERKRGGEIDREREREREIEREEASDFGQFWLRRSGDFDAGLTCPPTLQRTLHVTGNFTLSSTTLFALSRSSNNILHALIFHRFIPNATLFVNFYSFFSSSQSWSFMGEFLLKLFCHSIITFMGLRVKGKDRCLF